MTAKFWGIDNNAQRVQNIGAPSAANDATTKTYVDNLISGLSYKDEVKAATTGALAANTYANGSSGVGATLTANANAAFTAVDGEAAPALNDRYLIKDETGLKQGIYTLTTVGSGAAPWVLTRATDTDSTAELNNATVYVTNGTVNGGREYTQTTKNPVLGTDAIAWAQKTSGTTYIAGNGLTLTGSTFDVTNTDTSITVGADTVSVNLKSTPGLQVSSGVGILLDATNPGLQLTSGLKVLLNGSSLTLGASGLSVTNPYSSNVFATNNLVGTSNAYTHGLGTRDVLVQVYDLSTNETVYPDVTRNSTTQVTVSWPASVSADAYRILVTKVA